MSKSTPASVVMSIRNGFSLPFCPLALSRCVCVFFYFILDVKSVGCTSQGHTGGRPHRISHAPSFYGACLYFLARGVQPFLSLVDREVEFCVLRPLLMLLENNIRKRLF